MKNNARRNICVYASSSDAAGAVYFDAARELGTLLARRGCTLIFGAGCIGLMGEMARAVHAAGGHVVGVIPEKLVLKNVAYDASDEFIVTADMRRRKAIMEARADAFVAMPGGIGTLEEVLEVLVLKQLRYHAKPVVFLNTNGFFGPLLAMLDKQVNEHFAKASMRALFHVVSTPHEIFDYLDAYQPPESDEKWF